MPVLWTRSTRPVRSRIGTQLSKTYGNTFVKKDGADAFGERMVQILAEFPHEVFILLPPRCVSEYFRLDRVIGKGGFANVYESIATDKALKIFPTLEAGATYAIRNPRSAMEISVTLRSLRECSIEREIEFVRALLGDGRDDSCVHIFAILIEMPWKCTMVMEYMRGPVLFDFLSTSCSMLGEQDAACLAKQVIASVHYLHRTVGALHRDVKPENFGFAQEVVCGEPLPKLKMFDTGSIWALQELITEETARDVQPLPPLATPLYAAPEVWKGLAGAPSDLWAVGLVVHIILTHELPFGLLDKSDYRHAIQQEPVDFAAPFWESRSAGARNFVALLLEKSPEARTTSSAAFADEWLTQFTAPKTEAAASTLPG